MLRHLCVTALLICCLGLSANGQDMVSRAAANQANSADLVNHLLQFVKNRLLESVTMTVLVRGTSNSSSSVLKVVTEWLGKLPKTAVDDILAFFGKCLLGLLAIALFLLFRLVVHVFPRPGPIVSFSDLNAKSDDARSSSRSLTADILNLLEHPEAVNVEGLQMNTIPGTDQPAFGVVRPVPEMHPMTDFAPSEHPIKMGGIELTLQDLTQLITRLFSRPYREELVGWVRCGERAAVAEAEWWTRRRQWPFRARRQAWRAEATGDRARENAIGDLAAKILVGMGRSSFTDNWQSLKFYQDGIRVARKKGGSFSRDCSEEACRCFERAVAVDPANWIARFYFALALCQEGKPATALRHFRVLDEVLRSAVSDNAFKKVLAAKHNVLSRLVARLIKTYPHVQRARPRSERVRSLLHHIAEFPECPFIVQYNIAIAVADLCRSSGNRESFVVNEEACWSDPIQSLRTIAAVDHDYSPGGSSQNGQGDPLAAYRDCERHLSPKTRFQLSLYARSACAHLISLSDAAGALKEITSILQSIEETCKNARCLDRRIDNWIDNWRSLQTTRAVVLAALARVLCRDAQLKPNQEARDRFYEAIASEPNLVDAYVQLAKLYMRWRRQFADNWIARADSLLKRADELNPACDEIMMARADLFVMPVVGRIADALKILRSMAGSDPGALQPERVDSLVRLLKQVLTDKRVPNEERPWIECALNKYENSATEFARGAHA